jgi:drug/metabolite transporter (DMT)-like permease
MKAPSAIQSGTDLTERPMIRGPSIMSRTGLQTLEQQGLGVGLALLAYSLLAVQDATVKWLVVAVPVWQVLFVRSAILVVGCLAGGGRPLVRHAFTTPTIPLLALRGLVTLGAWFCYFTAARDLPLGQLVTLYYTAPVVVTLLAAPLLGERVGRARWAAVSVGFIGTVFAANPAGLSLSLPTALVLIGAALWGFGVVLTRQIARRELSLVQMFFNNCFFLVFTGVGCAITWHPLTTADALLLLQVASLGGLGQFCMFEAARRTPASLTAPLEYIGLVWAFALGFLVWGNVPPFGVFLGASLIFAAGAGLLIAERRRVSPAGAAA